MSFVHRKTKRRQAAAELNFVDQNRRHLATLAANSSRSQPVSFERDVKCNVCQPTRISQEHHNDVVSGQVERDEHIQPVSVELYNVNLAKENFIQQYPNEYERLAIEQYPNEYEPLPIESTGLQVCGQPENTLGHVYKNEGFHTDYVYNIPT